MKDILEKKKGTSAEARQMIQDGDRLKLKFIQNTRDPDGRPLVIFLAGNVYPGFVKISADGIKFILKHEYIPYQGTESEFSKEEFIDNLKFILGYILKSINYSLFYSYKILSIAKNFSVHKSSQLSY